MSTVAIICEYNPFHNGHKYHIEQIRREFGEDTVVIAIMSGNFTQRGDVAIVDKGIRAKCVIDAGCNLVFEIPFPYSMSSAEFFASAGVSIANSLGVVDVLSFGSECGNIDQLEKYAEIMLNPEFTSALSNFSETNAHDSTGYAKACQIICEKITGEKTDLLTPNNILAIEYIKALRKSGSSIKPHTVKRTGADFNDTGFVRGQYQSATAIREAISKNDITALEFVPDATKKNILDALNEGEFPCSIEKLSSAVISYFRLNPTPSKKIHDAEGGLYNRLAKACGKANNISQLVSLSQTKKYTTSRIRRAILYSYFGVTSSDVKENPEYTQLLGLDGIGRLKLKEIKKTGAVSILTKPSDRKGLSERAIRQKDIADKADSVFQLTKPVPKDGGYSLKFTPYVKN
jgi:predicted nucleotidyltransferase